MPANFRNDEADDLNRIEPWHKLSVEFDSLLAEGKDPQIAEFLQRYETESPGTHTEQTRQLFLLELVLHRQYYDLKRPGSRKTWDQYIAEWPQLEGTPEAVEKLQKQQHEREQRSKKETSFVPSPPPPRSTKQEWETRFKIIKRQIGQGGFGKVHLAYDPDEKRQVAIKVVDEAEIESHYAPLEAKKRVIEAKRLLQNEVKKLKSLFHPNIVRLLDFGFPPEPGQDWYLVYEYIDGGALSKRLDGGFPLDVTLAVTIAIKVARALHRAHQHEGKIIHRDIKPDNILLDSRNEPFLIDFGLAITKLDVQRGAGLGGTLRYLSPEQIEGNPDRISYRTDIYSLGVVLHEMLTGKWPFVVANKSDAAILKAIRDQDRVSLWVENSNAPQNKRVRIQLDAICKQAMQGLPGLRFDNADYMADQLEEVLDLLKHDQPAFVQQPVVDPVTEPEKAETDDVVPEDIVQPVSENATDENKQAPDAGDSAIDEDPPVRQPSQGENSKPFRLRRLIGLVVGLSSVAAVAAFVLGEGPPITKSVLANEFSKKEIGVHFQRASDGNDPQLLLPFLTSDGRWIFATPKTEARAKVGDQSVLGSWWRGEFTSEPPGLFESLRESGRQYPVWDFAVCEPSQLTPDAQLVLLNPNVFHPRTEEFPGTDCFSEARIRKTRQGNQFVEVDTEFTDVALGSPVFAAVPTTRLARWWGEHMRGEVLASEFRFAGIVLDIRSLERPGTTLVIKPASVLRSELRDAVPPKRTSSEPAVGTELTVRQTTAVRLTFDKAINANPAFKQLGSTNGLVKVREIKGADSRTVEIELTPESVGKVVVELPTGFVMTPSGVESQAETLNFIAKSDSPPPPKILKLVVKPPRSVVGVDETLMVTVSVATPSKEQLKLNADAILVDNADIKLLPDVGKEPNEFVLRFIPKAVGQMKVTIGEGLVTDLTKKRSKSDVSPKLVVTVVPAQLRMNDFLDRAGGLVPGSSGFITSGETLLREIAAEFKGLDVLGANTDGVMFVWESRALRAALLLDVAAEAHRAALGALDRKKDFDKQSKLFNDSVTKAKGHQESALQELRPCLGVPPVSDREHTAVELLLVRCHIGRAALVDPSQRKAEVDEALAWLDEALTILKRCEERRSLPESVASKKGRVAIELRRLGRSVTTVADTNVAPDIWGILRDSYSKYSVKSD